MSSVSNDSARGRRRVVNDIKDSVRDLRSQLTTLNRQISGKVALKDGDLDCLDLISRHGPLSPSGLARLAGLHPATVTGVIDRLERAGWVARERDAEDRRAVWVRALPERGAEVYRLYGGMNAALDDVCAGYDAEQLTLIAGFLRQTITAGEIATRRLATDGPVTP